MKKFSKVLLFTGGLLLTLAVFPVFAQQNQPTTDVEVNQRPFQDLFEMVKQRVDKREIDLTKSFSVEVEGTLDKSGRLGAKTAKFVKTEGDPKMAAIAKSFIEAVNDSGLFAYLKNINANKISFKIAQDDNQFYASIVSEQKTPEKLETAVSFLNAFLIMLRYADETNVKKLTDDERALFKGVKVSSENNNVILNFTYQKSVIQEMINRKLKENSKKASE
ncbi:MAG: hypothetical protein H0U87_01320 [Acidobacteria bacterium]|jgi:hypothetical protein|nr:hypothetical protein [Acidobacteriota bacterium]